MSTRRALRLALTGAVTLAAGLGAQTAGGPTIASLPASTRSQALGGAGVALVGDAAGLFANPASIAMVRHLALEGSAEQYLEGTLHTAAAIAGRVGRVSWGFGAQALLYGEEAEIVPDPATGGRRGMPTGATFAPSDVLAVGTLVYRFSLLAVGVSAKYAQQAIGGWSGDGSAADIGASIALFDIFALGVAVQNLAGHGNDIALPSLTRAGVTLNYTDPQGTVRILSTLEGQWREDHDAAMVIGVEGGVVVQGVGVLGRAGFTTPGSLTDASPWSVGGGVALGGVQLDYAYRPFDELGGGTHRLGVRWRI